MTCLFLYTEISAYTEACFRALAQKANIHVVKYPLNIEAPFQFSNIRGCTYYDRSQYNALKINELCKKIEPDVIFVSGWIDKEYLNVTQHFRGKIPIVLTMDNYWLGTLKQRLLCLLSPIYLKKYFSHVWVPGKQQMTYAQKLGFNKEQIKTGFYSADLGLFNQFYESFQDAKKMHFPKRFLYVGRYIAFKNMNLMCEAFIEALKEKESDWELWCIGTGELWDKKIEHPKINHIGFVQPKDIAKYVAASGVFVLPSIVENWGVVVHEYAASGFPLICSSGVGAASAFLQNSKNGFTFDPHNKAELTKIFLQIMDSSSKDLNQMGETSHLLAQQITPDIWATTALTFKFI